MSLDLLTTSPATPTWTDPAVYWPAMSRAIDGVSGPVAALDVSALRYNALDMVVRSGGVPIRVASKSVRVREVIDATLAIPGYHGILAFTLPEALWLAETHDDVVLGYPTVDRAAIAALVADERGGLARDAHGRRPRPARRRRRGRRARPARRASVSRSTRTPRGARPALGHIGVHRSPVHDAAEVANLARAIAARPGFRLVGLMMYEAQIAGQGDATGSGDAVDPLDAAALRARAARAPRRDRRRAARHRPARVRQRRRHRLARATRHPIRPSPS